MLSWRERWRSVRSGIRGSQDYPDIPYSHWNALCPLQISGLSSLLAEVRMEVSTIGYIPERGDSGNGVNEPLNLERETLVKLGIRDGSGDSSRDLAKGATEPIRIHSDCVEMEDVG